jgi:hypothetical protein
LEEEKEEKEEIIIIKLLLSAAAEPCLAAFDACAVDKRNLFYESDAREINSDCDEANSYAS